MVAKAGRIKNGARTDNFVARKARILHSKIAHNINRVSDNEKNSVEVGGKKLVNYTMENLSIARK